MKVPVLVDLASKGEGGGGDGGNMYYKGQQGEAMTVEDEVVDWKWHCKVLSPFRNRSNVELCEIQEG